ncbi:protein HGV2-like isoform X1 [Saccostrea cucullata]|uniref:protein HGV2-like isoform X1 n=1 Tax=Saccostrea cuccullata TaxID=36930 RepID=UPI002ED697D7
MMDTPGTSSSSDKERMEAAETAVAILAQGKRNMVCGEIPNAVNQFQEACKVLAKAYGETAKECAEAYFYYGQSLLDLARMETGVLGNALQGVPEEEETEDDKKPTEQFEPADINGEEREKLRMEVYDAMAEHEGSKEGEKECDKKESEGKEKMETDEEKKKSDGEPLKNGTVEGEKKEEKEEEGEEEGDEEEGETAEEGDTAEEGETAEEGDTAEELETAEESQESQEEGEEGKKKENPDDISNLQLAWEMLELAKVIYLKDEDKKSKLKAAESFLKLGEVSLETENYEQAISDFKECLKIQEAELEPDDRLLAETHYQLGLAHGFNKQYDDSIDQYRKAIKVMEAKMNKLKQKVEEGTQGKGKEPLPADDPIKAAQQEIKDLEEILPDIRSKIEDMEEEKKNIDELKTLTKETLAAATSELKPAESKDSSEPQKAASDISHLVRRKRKPEEENAEADTKKTRQEDGSGDATTKPNGTANEKSEPESDAKKKEAMDVEPPRAVAS